MKRRVCYLENCAIKGHSTTLGIELTIVHEVVSNMTFALEIEDREILQIAQEISSTAKSFTLSGLPMEEIICRIIDDIFDSNESIEDVKTAFINLFEEINVKVNKFFKMLYVNKAEDVKSYLKKRHRKVTNAIESCKFSILPIVDYYLEEIEMQ